MFKGKVISMLEQICFKKVSFQDKLVSTNILNSMGIVDLTVALEDEFNISIDAMDLKQEDFETV